MRACRIDANHAEIRAAQQVACGILSGALRVLVAPQRPSPHHAHGRRDGMATIDSTKRREHKSERKRLASIANLRLATEATLRRAIANRVDRFWSKAIRLDRDSCWLWQARRNPKGYGMFREMDRWAAAHRVSWELANGPIPTGRLVCHSCDTRSCVNPDHLFVGTNDDNMRDMVNKSRQSKGERHRKSCLAALPNRRIARGERIARSVLTEELVVKIRQEYSQGVRVVDLAHTYRVTPTCIYRVIRRQCWKHVA